MRLGAQWARGFGATLVAMATASAACADVVPIDLDECSPSCVSPTNDAEGALAGGATLSVSEGGRFPTGLRPDLIFDADALPSVLVNGLPSPVLTVEAQAFDGPGVSPYAFYATVIDVPRSGGASASTAVNFTPSFASQLSEFLWASNDFFAPPSGDAASRRGVPLSADAEALTGRLTTGWKMRMPVTPTLSPSPLAEPPPSAAAQPFGQAGDGAGQSGEFSLDGTGSNK